MKKKDCGTGKIKQKKPFYEEWWGWLTCGAVLLVFPRVIDWIYLFGQEKTIFATTYESSDVLNYGATVLSLAGTLILGIVAVRQTKQAHTMSKEANKISERLMALEEQKSEADIAPFILLTDWCSYEKISKGVLLHPECISVNIGKGIALDLGENYLCVELSFTNSSNNMITFEYSSITVYNNLAGKTDEVLATWLPSYASHQRTTQSVAPYQTERLVLYAPTESFPELLGTRLGFKMILQNQFGVRYAEYFDIIVSALQKDSNSIAVSEDKVPWFMHCAVQNYRLMKFCLKGKDTLEEKEII